MSLRSSGSQSCEKRRKKSTEKQAQTTQRAAQPTPAGVGERPPRKLRRQHTRSKTIETGVPLLQLATHKGAEERTFNCGESGAQGKEASDFQCCLSNSEGKKNKPKLRDKQPSRRMLAS